MKRILLILSPARVSSSCAEEAAEAARRAGAELVAVFILDTSMSDDVQKRLQDTGFLGEIPSEKLISTVREEQERQGTEALERIGRIARQRGVGFRSRLAVGEFVTTSLEVAREEDAEAIFVARRDRPAFSRLVAGSAVRDLEESAPCRVLVRDAEEEGD